MNGLLRALADLRGPVGPIAIRVGAAAARVTVGRVDLLRGGGDPARTLALLAGWLSRGGLRTASPRYFGYPGSSADGLSVAGDALAAALDVQLALRDTAPIAYELERAALGALAIGCGFSGDPEGSHFTTGASEGLSTALGCALLRACPEARSAGVFALGGAPRVYASHEAHRSLVKCARAAGWGDESVVQVRSNAGRMIPEALAERVARDRAEGRRPVAIVATVGSTVTGAADPIADIADIAGREGLWLHVDAAWAGGFALCARGRGLFVGVARADSVAWDASKFPGMAVGTGMLWTADGAWTRALYEVEGEYVPPGGGHLFARSAPWSRRAIGLKVFLSLAVHGVEGWAREASRWMGLGDRLRSGLLARGWTVENDSELPVVCVRHPALQDERGAYGRLVRRVLREHDCWVTAVPMADGAAALRAAIASSRTDEPAVDALLAALTDP
jgi:aromatic-L-amino-acid decarboxylase